MSSFRFRFLALAILVFFSTTGSTRNISEVSLTECGVNCYEKSCNSTTDVACVCTEPGFNDIVQCLSDTCGTATNYYISYRRLFHDCDIPRPVWTVDPEYTATAIIVFIIQTLFFGLRVFSRWTGLGKWGWDDTTCVVAYVILIGQLVMCILLGHYGNYVNYWTLDLENFPPFFKIDFARAQLYAVGLGASKMSIVFLYQRVFEGPRLRRALLATQALNALLALSYVVAAFLVARPFGCDFALDLPAGCAYDDVWDGSGAYSAANAALDVWLVALPAAVVGRLQMRTERKVNVVAVFATGILTCLIAILRVVVYRLQGAPDLSEYQYQLYIWVAYYAYYAELTSCFVIACLPAVRQLVGKKVWPVLKTSLSALSSTWASSLSRSSRRGTSTGYVGGYGTRTGTAISAPLEGSFQHLTGHLQAESPRRSASMEGVGYAL